MGIKTCYQRILFLCKLTKVLFSKYFFVTFISTKEVFPSKTEIRFFRKEKNESPHKPKKSLIQLLYSTIYVFVIYLFSVFFLSLTISPKTGFYEFLLDKNLALFFR